jgi:hypothetical protein
MEQHVMLLQQMLAPPPAPTEPAKGENGALDQAVSSGALRPAAPKGAHDALGRAVTSGALRPAGTGAAQQKHERGKQGRTLGNMVRTGVLKPAGGKPGAKPTATTSAPTAPGAAV